MYAGFLSIFLSLLAFLLCLLELQIKGSWINPNAAVIYVATNAVDDSSRKSGYRLVGDVDFHEACKVASCIWSPLTSTVHVFLFIMPTVGEFMRAVSCVI